VTSGGSTSDDGVDRVDGVVLDWSSEGGDTWTRDLPVAAGEPPLLLRVYANEMADRGDDPWLWEVVEAGSEGDPADGNIDTGGASTREAAMAAAIEEATAHIGILAAE
jgi:hypothetical protein